MEIQLKVHSTLQFTGMFNQMVDKGKSAIKQIEETDELVSLRIQTKKHEIILTPECLLFFKDQPLIKNLN